MKRCRIKKELGRMKGKRTCKEKILAFMLSFVVTAGMVMETVQLQTAESGPVSGTDRSRCTGAQ